MELNQHQHQQWKYLYDTYNHKERNEKLQQKQNNKINVEKRENVIIFKPNRKRQNKKKKKKEKCPKKRMCAVGCNCKWGPYREPCCIPAEKWKKNKNKTKTMKSNVSFFTNKRYGLDRECLQFMYNPNKILSIFHICSYAIYFSFVRSFYLYVHRIHWVRSSSFVIILCVPYTQIST